MVPHTAAGASQAMESCALLLNELGDILKNSQGSKISGTDLKAAFARYSKQRAPRSTQVQELAGIVAAGQLLHRGVGGAVIKELPTLTDGDWMFRAFGGLPAAPVVNGIPLSTSGNLYNEALANFMQRFHSRQYSNMEVFGLS
jgi:2-polyprenyl-6-methoxyphenol hydroxylase-like FAD-dependent oxidoreductase